MRQVATYLSPIIVVLGVLFFTTGEIRFVLPVIGEILGLGLLFIIAEPLRRKTAAESWLLFWLAPVAMMWLLSERREGRDVSQISIVFELLLAGTGTSILLSSKSLKKEEFKLVVAIILIWLVSYFSGSSGGADKMHPWFAFLNLTSANLDTLIIAVRKTIHVTFYGTLMWLFATYLLPLVPNRRTAIGFAIAFPLCISICDEFRQSMMPNRSGSYADVILDMSSAIIVLLVLLKVSARKKSETPT